MFIKICGVKTFEEIEIVERYADATGVIVESNTKRCVSIETAHALIRSTSIPVFVVSTATSIKKWCEIIEKTDADYIQIHSDMPSTKAEILKKSYGVKIAKAFRVPRKSENVVKDVQILSREIEAYPADFYILDTGEGTGKIHDLRISKTVAERYPIILAGGLNPRNVREVLEYVNPWGVDVSSGVEKEGKKNENLVKEFVERVRV